MIASDPPPMFPHVGVLAIPPDVWTDQWMEWHQVLTRLSRFFVVLWVEPALEWRDRLKTGKRAAVGPAGATTTFGIYLRQQGAPTFYRPRWLAEYARRSRLRRAGKVLRRRGCAQIILYLWRPRQAYALEAVPHDLSCYHISDEYSFSDTELPLDPEEQRLIGSVNQVIIHSPALFAKKGKINERTALIPNGVDYRAYATPAPEPADLASIPRPRIGYTGFVKKQLDWPLLVALAEAHEAWSFVLVGEVKPHPEFAEAFKALEDRANVHFLGGKTSEELAAYPQHFDVCTMPYQLNDYTQYIYPLKLHEYLASGRPVVGTPIQSLLEFGDVVALPTSFSEWSAALRQALSPSMASPALVEARRAIARRHDWDVIARRIAETMAGGLQLALPSDPSTGPPPAV